MPLTVATSCDALAPGQPIPPELEGDAAELAHLLTQFASRGSAQNVDLDRLEHLLSLVVSEELTGERVKAVMDLLVRSTFLLFEAGRPQRSIEWSVRTAALAEAIGDYATQRRLLSFIGGLYGDIADFPAAMKYLEMALAIAKRLHDKNGEAACLGNIVAVLQEMGHYRQAITIARRIIDEHADTVAHAETELQAASNGLFASYRIGDASAASTFLIHGERFLKKSVSPLRRAFFERSRVLYLIDNGEAQAAAEFLRQTHELIAEQRSPRITTLLAIANALCEWGAGRKREARDALRTLYEATARSRLYHHFVLQALVKVFSDGEREQEVGAGLAFAKELIEFTTSVKKAKFYKQLQARSPRETPSAGTRNLVDPSIVTNVDPFGVSKDWLLASDVAIPTDGGTQRRELATHEELTAIHEDMARLRVAGIRREIRTDAVDTAENWAIAAEFFDDETGQHCFRVGHLASMLAREVGMRDTFCFQIEHAARLHDIGKIAVNEVILLKPGPLDAAEMAAMRMHTEVGSQILSGSDDPTLKMAASVARHHHEWWNGNGYPLRISGRDIPLAARISAYADVYDALTHARSYKSAWSHERALAEISLQSGIQFDPALLEPFIRVLERYRADLAAGSIPGLADMQSNSLIASRRKLMETIGGQ